MNNILLKEQWGSLERTTKKGLSYIRIDGACIPELNLAITNDGLRSLLLKVPSDYINSFTEEKKENLRISFSSEGSFLLLELLDNYYSNLFDDLIISLYHKIKDVSNREESTKIFIVTIRKWASFMKKGGRDKLSKEIILGLYGEMIVLEEHLRLADSSNVDEILNAWQGPYNATTDFEFEAVNEEVKAISNEATSVRISSEFQLDDNEGKKLKLTVVRVDLENGVDTISSLLTRLRKRTIEVSGDMTILFRALSQKGIFLRNIEIYDGYKFQALRLDKYDCDKKVGSVAFPSIKKSLIAKELHNVSYKINLTQLKGYITEVIKLLYAD